jgi:hypothetical protein
MDNLVHWTPVYTIGKLLSLCCYLLVTHFLFIGEIFSDDVYVTIIKVCVGISQNLFIFCRIGGIVVGKEVVMMFPFF